MRRGKKALTVYNEAVRNGVLAPTGTTAATPVERGKSILRYEVEPQIGDIVQWRHSMPGMDVYLKGTVRALLEPVQEQWSVIKSAAAYGDCPTSRRLVEVVEECLALAEREKKRMTPAQRAAFSREWQELFADLEAQGYSVEWRTYEQAQGGQVVILGHGADMGMFVYGGKWLVSSAFVDPVEGLTDGKVNHFHRCEDARFYIKNRLFLLKGQIAAYGHGGGAA